MTNRTCLSAAAAFAALIALGAAHPALALTSKECSANYKAAKAAGTLNGQSWNAYRTANCSATATPPATPAAATTPATTATPAPAAKPAAPVAAATPAKTAAPAPAGSPVFPSAIDAKYASLKAGTGRMKTCDDQYKANKATGGNAGMKWIEKGGGYYSACSKHLKGA